MIELVKAWIVLTFMRILNAFGWPVWALFLIALVVVPFAIYKWLKEIFKVE